MIPRRRPVAALFSALLIWLTAVGTVRAAHPDVMRWMGIEADSAATPALVASRSTAVAPRLPSRSSAIPQADVPFPPAQQAPLLVVSDERTAPAILARVRRANGLASTYDATAPPLGN